MQFEPGKKSGQIPAFGDWDKADQLPITQYFESARQAGLLHYTTNTHHRQQQRRHHQYSDNSHISSSSSARASGGVAYGYAYTSTADFQKPPLRVVHHVPPPHRKAKHGVVNNGGEECNRGRTCWCPQHQYQERIRQAYDGQGWVVDVKHQQQHRTRRSSSSQQLFNGDLKKKFPKHSAIADVHKAPPPATHNNAKPVDEDLYKIPPELLLHHSKKKRMLEFFSKCLVPPCRD